MQLWQNSVWSSLVFVVCTAASLAQDVAIPSLEFEDSLEDLIPGPLRPGLTDERGGVPELGFGITLNDGQLTESLQHDVESNGIEMRAPLINDGSLVPQIYDGVTVLLQYGNGMKVSGKNLVDPLVLEALKDIGAFYGQPDPAAILAQRKFRLPDESVSGGELLLPEVNPLFAPDVWQRLQDLMPYFMPVGPDGSSPVPIRLLPNGNRIAARPSGAALMIGDPTKLDWTGGLTDTSCFRPSTIKPNSIGLSVNAARLSTVLITPISLLDVDPNGTGSVYRFPKCSDDIMSARPAHCSGLIEADGRTIWTAHHCVASPSLNLVGAALQGLPVGQSGPCDAATALRVVAFLGLTTEDHRVPSDLIARCDSVTRVARDVVRLQLSQSLPVPFGDNAGIGTWRFPRPGELSQLLIADRRLYGLGYLHSAVLYDLPGGRLFPVQACARTLASLLPKYDGSAEPADVTMAAAALIARAGTSAMSVDGFACISTDIYNGASGGPVFAVDDSGTELVLVGIISGAVWADFDMECQNTVANPLTDTCGGAPDGRLNIMALVPEMASAD